MKEREERARIAALRRNDKRGKPPKPDSERWPELSIRKVDASTVPFGVDVSRNGKTCWAAYHDGKLIAVGATHDEARWRYRDWAWRNEREKAQAKLNPVFGKKAND
jgi:hypothetical protein